MLRVLTAGQIAEWMAYFNLEPWGDRHRDQNLALVAAKFANGMRGKDSRIVGIEDFMITTELDEKHEQANDQAAINIFKSFKKK